MNSQASGWGTPRISHVGDFLRVIGSAHYFFGPFATSPDGRYLIGWSHGVYDEDNDLSHAATAQQGSFILLKAGEVLLHGWCSGPTLGRVSDNGTALIVDTAENGGSSLQVFDRNGTILCSQIYRHPIGQCGISAQGRHVAVHEATSVRATDRLNLIDLATQETLWQQFLPYQAQPVLLDVVAATGMVRAVYHDGVEAIYDFEGRLDAVHLRNTKMQSNDPQTLLALAREESAELAAGHAGINRDKRAREIFEWLRRASQATPSNELRAQILETTGELMESLSLTDKAIDAYQKAVALDPQVGCRRRLQALQRQRGN